MQTDATGQKFLRMTRDPVESLVLRLAGPTIAIMLISSMYNMADSFFVGQLGTAATGAVGVSFSFMAIIQAVGFLFGHGSGNFISRELGAQRIGNAAEMAATGFFSALIIGAVIALTGLACIEPLALFLGSTGTILPHACDYLFYILIGSPCMTGSLMLNNLLRFQGSAFYGMVGMVSGAILNVVLDPLFIFVFDMGVGGAGLATMISQFVGLCLLIIGCSRQGNIRIQLRNFRPGYAAYKEILRGGFPSLCRQTLASVATICLNQASRQYGDAVIAGISIVQRVMMFAGSALLGLGQGFQPVCGFNYGAGLGRRVRSAFWFCVKISFGGLLAMAVLGFYFAPDIIKLFRRDDPEAIRVGALSLRLQCAVFPLMSWVILNNMMLQTIGRAFRASLLALARQGLFLLPALFILEPLFGVLGIQLSQPISDLATFVLSLPIGIGVLREMGGTAGTKQCEPNEFNVVAVDMHYTDAR